MLQFVTGASWISALNTSDHTGFYNAGFDLLNRPDHGRALLIDARGSYTRTQIRGRAFRFANWLRAQSVPQEARILLALHDGIGFYTAFLGAILAGVVPVPVNTLLPAHDLGYLIRDSRARWVIASDPQFLQSAIDLVPTPPNLLPEAMLEDVIAQSDPLENVAETHVGEPCFWLYSSGSTGRPKGTVHRHGSLILTAELYARAVLGITDLDIVFSAAKLFFGYGLGNSLTFPLALGSTVIVTPDRPTPAHVCDLLVRYKPTIFFGVPTLFAGILAAPELPHPRDTAIRFNVSAGEALPAEIGRRWAAHFGADILDGLGSTEMLHIFLSNAPGDIAYGGSGRPVPGYDLRLSDEQGKDVRPGDIGDLWVRGPTSALGYWRQREKTLATFQGPWVRTGDKFQQTPDGRYRACGRSDDMLKVGGIFVSPAEVENALIAHHAVLEAAVIGAEDEAGLIKPKAFIVLKPNAQASVQDLQAYVKSSLAPYKYPRWIVFVDTLPKTATGKIQRFKLRDSA
jgi:benzoate-CoA ligase